MIFVVTNMPIKASRHAQVLLDSGRIEEQFNLVNTTRVLLDLPDNARIIILDYRTGKNPECICEVARLMVRRGTFEEVELA